MSFKSPFRKGGFRGIYWSFNGLDKSPPAPLYERGEIFGVFVQALIKIFGTSIKTAVRQAIRQAHGPEQSRGTHSLERSRRAEKKQK